MKLNQAAKSISELKAHASEVIRDVSENQRTLVITHYGEARVVLQDIKVYEQTQETLALLKMLAQSQKSQREGRIAPLDDAFASVLTRVRSR